MAIKGDYVVRAAVEADVEYLKGKLRASDYIEVRAFSGIRADDWLLASMKASQLCWTGLNKDRPVCIFGVAAPSILSRVGTPWLLGTREMNEVGLAIVRRSRKYISEMKALYPKLENYVDARHKASIQWLKWCGFTIHEPQPYGPKAKMFHYFCLE